MATDNRTCAELKAENENLRMRLAQVEEKLCDMTGGKADGLVITGLLAQQESNKTANEEASRNRYSDLYDFAPLGYVTLNNKGVIQAINLTGARLLGTPRPALIGLPLSSHLSKEDSRKLLKHLRQSTHTGEQSVTELGIIVKGGTVIQVQLSTVASHDSAGLIRYRTAITDITELKKTEESLRRLNQLYAVLSETGKAIVYSADSDTLFREICRVAVEHGGFLLAWIGIIDKESGIVKPAASYGLTSFLDNIRISASDNPAGREPIGTAIYKGSYCICNDFFSDPSTRPWYKSAQAIGLKSLASIALKLNGEVIGALTIYASDKDFFKWQFTNLLKQMAADISFALDGLDREANRRKAELALRKETTERLRAVEELHERDRLLLQQSRQAALGDVIGNIAHQWRQPLNALGLVIQELSLVYELGNFTKEHLDSTVKTAMEIIFRMSRTIDDFSNFYKPDRNKRWFKVNDVVMKTVSLIEPSFKEYRITVNTVAGEDLEIKGYPNDYAQVLLNILVNARDALLERGVADPWVTVCARKESGRSVVIVSDNAGGIGEDILEQIFDLYFTTKESGLGTGIGLFMAKIIIEKNMGGFLTVRNARYGAEFRIEV
jgi:PAS domain S-box-containing protein